MKFYRLTLDGELSISEVQTKLQERESRLLRIDRGKGQTRVYYASRADVLKMPLPGKLDEAEVSMKEITKYF